MATKQVKRKRVLDIRKKLDDIGSLHKKLKTIVSTSFLSSFRDSYFLGYQGKGGGGKPWLEGYLHWGALANFPKLTDKFWHGQSKKQSSPEEAIFYHKKAREGRGQSQCHTFLSFFWRLPLAAENDLTTVELLAYLLYVRNGFMTESSMQPIVGKAHYVHQI